MTLNLEVPERVERILKESHILSKHLHELADEIARRAEQWVNTGVGNREFDKELADKHEIALGKVIAKAEELEQAAIDEGILPRRLTSKIASS